MARERGIKIICDEIMCGLGRHGKGTLFISEAWDLDPDCVTVRTLAQECGAKSGAGRDTAQHLIGCWIEFTVKRVLLFSYT